MTELQKMLSGYEFESEDNEIYERSLKAQRYIKTLNALTPERPEQKLSILKQLFDYVSPTVRLQTPFFCSFGFNINIGSNTFINMNCVFLDYNNITIGEGVLIGPCVNIYTITHPVSVQKRKRIAPNKNDISLYNATASPVKIGDNVWIGGGSIILPGVVIGNNTTIGAGSIVTKSIPSDVLAVGNPCRVLRNLHP